MAHIQRRCARCRHAIPEGKRACDGCGGRRLQVIARYRDRGGAEHSQTFTRVRDAEDYLAEQTTKLRRNEWVDPKLGEETLGAFWRRWKAHAEETGKPAERTLIAYEEIMRLYVLPTLESQSLGGLTRADVREVVDRATERSPWRGVDTLKVLRRLLNAAVDEEIIVRNPAARIPTPHVEQGEPWVLTPAEVEALADVIESRYRALVLAAAYSSLRWSELVGLRVDRLDLPRCRIRVEEKITEHGRLIPGEPKTRQSRRAVSIPQEIAFEIAEHLRRFPPGDDGLVFPAPEGGPLRRPHFGTAWRKARKAAGLEGFPFKNLRHTGASLAIAAGANPLLVASRLGHTSTRMVERHYVSLFEGLDAEIGVSLGKMRTDREAEGQRLRPAADSQSHAGQMRDRDGTGNVAELPERHEKRA